MLTQTEVYSKKTKRWSITIEKNKVKSVSYSTESGISVRVIENGKIGMASCTNCNSKDELEKIAKEISKYSGEELESFPDISFKSKSVKVYDPKFSEICSEDLVSYAEVIVESLRKSVVSSAHVNIVEENTYIKNNTGECNFRETVFEAFAEIVYSNGNPGSSYCYVQSRKVKDKVEKLLEKEVETAEDYAIRSANPHKIDKSRVKEVVLSTLAMEQLLTYTLFPAFSAENVVKGRSPIKKGDFLGWEFDVYDDPLIDWGIGSYPFDDEGVAANKKTLVKDGVVKEFLSNWKYSKVTGDKAGNALREDVSSYPVVHPSNIVLEIDTEDFDFENKLYVHSLIGAHTANPVSGDFSVECMNAFFNNKAVKVMLYGNVYNVLKHAVLQKNVKQIGNVVCGDVLFENAFNVI